MFVNAAVLLASLQLFSFAFLGTNVQAQDCQYFSTCSCSWEKCCTQLDCASCYQTFSCQIDTEGVSWCTVQVYDKNTPSLINTIKITFENDCVSCTNGEDGCVCSDGYTVMPITCSTVSTYSPLTPSSQSSDVYSDNTLVTSSLVTLTPSLQSSDVYRDTTLVTSSPVTLTPSSQSSDVVYSGTTQVTSSLSTVNPLVSIPLIMVTHLLLSNTHFTTSINRVSITTSSVPPTPSSSVPVTSNIISVVVPAVGTALLCLVVAAVFGSILALVLCKTKRKQFPLTNNSDQMSQQRMDNTYSAVQITDLSSTDGVYSTLDREETTTEMPHNLNTPALPTYSSLADVQQNTSNIENLPLNYDVVRLENMSGSKIGVIDPYSSLAEDTSNVKELPQNYDVVRLENMSENKTLSGVIAQDSAEFIRVQPAPVYSTVVRQNGKKMTVRLDTPITLVDEKNAE